MKSGYRYAFAALFGVLLGLAGVAVVEPRLPTSPLVRGVRIGGEPAPVARGGGEEPVRGWLEGKRRDALERRVTLRHGEHRFEATLGELGVELDVEATLRPVRDVGHEGSVVRRLRETGRARRGEVDLPLVWRHDGDKAKLHIATWAPQLKRAPVDARLDLDARRNVPDVPGAELDLDSSYGNVRAEALKGEVDLVTRAVFARVTTSDLAELDPSQVLSSYETTFHVFKVGRSANIALAASRINGLILQPQQILSFNEAVGARTVENGFQQAPEIQGDELTMGIGGGTCQVSGTLFASALHAGLGIVERKAHTRPSDYVPLGLDATVSYGAVDLKLQNTHRFPIVIHAFLPEPGKLRVELLGGKAVEKIEYKYGVARIEAFTRRITVKSFLKEGRFFRHQKGTRGMDVHSFVTITFLDGRSESRQYYSGYKATPEVFWVAPDYDEAKLPDLPEHAKGVEGRLAENVPPASDDADVYPM